jgi:hypothetical protein
LLLAAAPSTTGAPGPAGPKGAPGEDGRSYNLLNNNSAADITHIGFHNIILLSTNVTFDNTVLSRKDDRKGLDTDTVACTAAVPLCRVQTC